jgi:starch-binding outer membrane protein, SusD/RagB family
MKMRKIAIAFIVIGGLFTTACDLDVDPQASVDATTALTDQAKVESAVVGMYSILGRGALYGTNLFLIPELIGAESNIQWRGTFQSFREVANKSMVSENVEASRTWIAAYDGINLANNILAAADVVPEGEDRDRIRGEALFVRGILHFELVRLFAKDWSDGNPNTNLGIPIRLTSSVNEEQASVPYGRNTVAEVYAEVIDDLTEARDLLPKENGVKATKWAASAFLARVYLQQADFTNALTEADSVIERGFFNLNPTVTAAFLNDNTSESIFEIQQNDQNNAGSDNDGMATFYASLVGIGRGDVQILSYYSEDEDDYIFTDRVTTYDLYEDQDTRKTALTYEGVGRRPGRIYSAKWTSPGQNLPVIRLAEMYLIRAEANLELDSDVGASPIDDINLIRERAKASLLGSVTLDDVYLERRFELAFEGARSHDIKRLGLTIDGYAFDDDANTYLLDHSIPYNDPFMIFPIPQREIDANSAIDDQQNPSY